MDWLRLLKATVYVVGGGCVIAGILVGMFFILTNFFGQFIGAVGAFLFFHIVYQVYKNLE